MKIKTTILIMAVAKTLLAQTYETNNPIVQTFAGSAFNGYLDGQGQQTMFSGPSLVVADSSGNLFVADRFNGRIREIAPTGWVSTFAGGGPGSLPGYGTNVSISSYVGSPMIIDSLNVIWIASGSSLIRIDPSALVSRTSLSVSANGICLDSQHNFYFSSGNKIYRQMTNGTMEVFVGSGNSGSIDGNGVFTSFYGPATLAADAADNIYVWDAYNYLIRRINQNRDVAKITGTDGSFSDRDGVGTNAHFFELGTMAIDNYGNILVACGTCIRKITATTNVTTIAGSFSQGGYTNGPGNLARFSGAYGVCISQGIIYVADSNNERIRSISFDPSIQPVSPANLALNTYPGLTITGSVGRTYKIESSPDLSTWAPEVSLLLTRSPYLWFDQSAVNGHKFYRALLLP